MIHSVEVTNYLGERLSMELRNPERSGFLIFNMTGIGPEKANIMTTDMATTDGSIYNSSRLPTRNILLSLRFFAWKDKTVEEIRHESYKYFPIKSQITLKIVTDTRVGVITGYVESNVPVIFSKETHTQLSIICPDPYFYSERTNVTVFSGIEAAFEFPFSNEMGHTNLISPRNITLPSTSNGLTLSYDEITNIYTLNGTNTSSEAVMFTTISENFAWLNNQKYSLSYYYVSGTMTDDINISPNQYESYINESIISEETLRTMITFGGNHEDFDYTSTNVITGIGSSDITTASKWKFQIIALPKTVFTNLKFKLQFELGDPTSWEPYPSSSSEAVKKIVFGYIYKHTEGTIVYDGDAKIGITMYIDAIGPATNLTIYNVGTREVMAISSARLISLTGSGIVAGDQIIISTIRGAKSIYLLRAGAYINILNTLDRNTDWFQLSKGDNLFAFNTDTGLTNLSFRIENKTIFEGM